MKVCLPSNDRIHRANTISSTDLPNKFEKPAVPHDGVLEHNDQVQVIAWRRTRLIPSSSWVIQSRLICNDLFDSGSLDRVLQRNHPGLVNFVAREAKFLLPRGRRKQRNPCAEKYGDDSNLHRIHDTCVEKTAKERTATEQPNV